MNYQQIRPCDPAQQAHLQTGERLRKRDGHMTRLHLADRALSARFARLWRRIDHLACSVFLKRTESPADHGQAGQPDTDPDLFPEPSQQYEGDAVTSE